MFPKKQPNVCFQADFQAAQPFGCHNQNDFILRLHFEELCIESLLNLRETETKHGFQVFFANKTDDYDITLFAVPSRDRRK